MKTVSTFLLFLSLGLTAFADGSSDRHHSDFNIRDLWGARYQGHSDRSYGFRHERRRDVDAVRRWNTIAVNASGYDHAGAREQLGPGRASRALAIVHIAMFDAINTVTDQYETFADVQQPSGPISLEAAVSQAAHDTLRALFPSQAATFVALLAEDLEDIRHARAKANGVLLGQRAAVAILALKANDGSEVPEPRVGIDHATSDQPGHWRQDPVSQIPLALGVVLWGKCVPFVLRSASQFRIPPPPAMNSRAYAIAFNEVKRLGGDGVTTPTERTPDQTLAGIFWAYDGVPNLCAPPRLFNQVATHIADQMGTDALETARLLVLVNVAMSEATLTCWESKYLYDVWRPVTGIRESDTGTGPTGLGDGNAVTVGDVNFSPLGAPASNLNGPNFTPPFPAYPSGHASMGAALFQTLRRFYGTDRIRFTFVSDEFNGVTRDNGGNVRPLIPRTFRTLSQAEEENGQSRIYLGIHWAFDKTEGIAMGRRVADHVFKHAFTPRRQHLNGDHDD